jgi:hypothetical protein
MTGSGVSVRVAPGKRFAPLRSRLTQQLIGKLEQHLSGRISGSAEITIELDAISSFGSE